MSDHTLEVRDVVLGSKTKKGGHKMGELLINDWAGKILSVLNAENLSNIDKLTILASARATVEASMISEEYTKNSDLSAILQELIKRR